jgi:hypothetical protein
VSVGSVLPNAFRPGSPPLTRRWALGIGDALAGIAPGPDAVRAAARLLNRFGGVAISGDGVEFDGDAVDWDDVERIEAPKLIGYLLSGALDKQIDRLPVPWFPFRGFVLDAAAQAALTVFVAAAGDLLGDALEVRVPAEVRYRGVLRHRTLSPGLLATLLLADPAVKEALIDTASAHGVAVQPATDDPTTAAQRRAQQLRGVVRRIL